MPKFSSKIRQYVKGESPFTFFWRIIKYFVTHLLAFKDNVTTEIIKEKLKEDLVIKEILGSQMFLDLRNDTGVSYELYKAGIREKYIVGAMMQEIDKHDVIIDIGANIGYYALLEARLGADVYAIEPVPKNIELLEKSIRLNEYSNIKTFRLAVGSQSKEDFIYVTEKANWSSLKKPDSDIVDKVPVSVVTLDEFLRNKPTPTMVRMDVEGYETEIIKGAKGLLGSNIPLKFLIETHFHIIEDEQKIRDFLLAFKDNGFIIKRVTHEPDAFILSSSRFTRRLVNFLMRKTDYPYGSLNLTIDDLLNDKLLLQGRRPCLEILFERHGENNTNKFKL